MRIVSFKAPTPNELRHDFLWRVMRQLPRPGEIVIFNRSHYEDVLIANARELASPQVIETRYGLITGSRPAQSGFSPGWGIQTRKWKSVEAIQRATVLIRLPKGVRRGQRALFNHDLSLVLHSRQPEVVLELGCLADSHRNYGNDEVDLSQPAPRRPSAEKANQSGGLKWQPSKPAGTP